ncbi:unnamed protein product [Owenia fusiformis]|nr:unnamed protein product [Owenia fusiformis]
MMGSGNGKCCEKGEEGEETKPHVLPGFELKYGVNDAPPWYLSILLGFQTYLIMFGATLAIPFLLAKHLCISDDYVALSELISTIFFCSGIATLLQTTFGVSRSSREYNSKHRGIGDHCRNQLNNRWI